MFKIGNVEIKGKIICAPMAGVTNKAFRKLVRANGAALVYTEMTSNVGLKYNSAKTLKHASIDPDESPVALQIFGGEVVDYVAAAKYFDEHSHADIIDINMGCPVQKVAIKSQAGSSLMKTPAKIKAIIEGVTKVIKKPLTIKIRLGWDDQDQTYLEVAKIAEAAGAAAIAVHGRNRAQMFKGEADWQKIKEIKAAVNIPVIGNGDVASPEDAQKMLAETGVDGVMIARAARDYPFIFKQCQDFFQTGKYEKRISLKQMVAEIKNFYQDLVTLKGPVVAFKEIKGVAANWLTNYNGIKHIKNQIVRAPDLTQFNLELSKLV